MKKIFLAMTVSLAALSGCVENSALIKTGSSSLQSGVFRELSSGGVVPQGYADMRITSSVKTHLPDSFPYEKNSHGTPDYRLLVNIDGQALRLSGDLQTENTEARGMRDPEAGAGVRYGFSKTLRLKAGTHKIIVALPDDNVAAEREITLSEQSSNNLAVEPGYGAASGQRRPGFTGSTSFKEGVKRLWLSLNGEDL
jgi:hypothetical protein